MSELITADWLNRTLERKFSVKDGKFQNDWWDCGWRFDNGVGATVVRVIDVGDSQFYAEIAQDVEGAGVQWSSGVGFPVKTVEELRKLCEGVKVQSRLVE